MLKYKARQLQILLFTKERCKLTVSALWAHMFDNAEPSVVQTTNHGQGAVHPMTMSLVVGKVDTAQGAVQDIQFTIQIQNHRVDVFAVPQVGDTASAPMFDDYALVGSDLAARIARSLQNIGPTPRVGCITYLVSPVADDHAVTAEIFAALGLEKTKSDGFGDAVFSVNKRTQIDGLELNRLIKWQGERFFTISFSNAEARPSNVVFVSLNIDINTIPEQDYSSVVGISTFQTMIKESTRLSASCNIEALDG